MKLSIWSLPSTNDGSLGVLVLFLSFVDLAVYFLSVSTLLVHVIAVLELEPRLLLLELEHLLATFCVLLWLCLVAHEQTLLFLDLVVPSLLQLLSITGYLP